LAVIEVQASELEGHCSQSHLTKQTQELAAMVDGALEAEFPLQFDFHALQSSARWPFDSICRHKGPYLHAGLI
jgi:hypothetical protein